MKTALIGLLFVASLARDQGQLHNWRNDFTQPLNFTCPDGQIISYLYSNYSNTYYDRVWEMGCRSVSTTSKCIQTDWINDWNQNISSHCPELKILTGIESYYNSISRDRRYRLTCCLINGKPRSMCYYSPPANDYNGPLTKNVAEGEGISNFFTIYSQIYIDRQFSFHPCQI